MFSRYPLQIYASGLVFSPRNSLVKKVYARLAPTWAALTIHPEDNWPPHLTSFDKDSGTPTSAAYSNDGRHIAINLGRGGIVVYDVITGSLRQRGKISESARYDPSGFPGVSYEAMEYDETNSNIFFLSDNIMERILYMWDLKLSYFKEMRRFPRHSKLSPSAKFVSCCRDNGMRLYDIESNETFLLPSTDALVGLKRRFGPNIYGPSEESLYWYSPSAPPSPSLSPTIHRDDSSSSTTFTFTSSWSSRNVSISPCHAFSIDAHGVVVQWINGSIEVWNIAERSIIRTFQEPRVSDGNIALSRESKILAIIEEKKRSDSDIPSDVWICGRVTKFQHRIRVLSVETGALVWQSESNIVDGPRSISFSKHDEVLFSGYNSQSYLSDARSGVCLGVLPSGGSFTKTIWFKQQLAIVSSNTVRLFDCNQLQVPTVRSFQIVKLSNRHLHVLVEETDEWFEGWDADGGDVLWTTPSTKSKEFVYGRCVVSSNYSAMIQDGIVVVFKRKDHLFEKHTSFSMSGEAKLYFSPDDTRLVCCGHDFAIAYDTETCNTDKTTFVWGALYTSKPLWSANGQRMLMHSYDQPRSALWSLGQGFEEVEVDTEGDKSFSPSGTWFASLITREQQSSLPRTGEDEEEYRLGIWNFNKKEVLRTKFFQKANKKMSLWCFAPCETRIFMREHDMLHIFSIAGERISSLHFYTPDPRLGSGFKINSDAMILLTGTGVLQIHENVCRGTIDEPFIDEHWQFEEPFNWIYQNNRKVLWLPPSYYRGVYDLRYSNGRYAFRHENGNIAVLRLDFDKKQ